MVFLALNWLLPVSTFFLTQFLTSLLWVYLFPPMPYTTHSCMYISGDCRRQTRPANSPFCLVTGICRHLCDVWFLDFTPPSDSCAPSSGNLCRRRGCCQGGCC